MEYTDTAYEMVRKDGGSVHVLDFEDKSVGIEEFNELLMTMDARIAMMDKLTDEALIEYSKRTCDSLCDYLPITDSTSFGIQVLIPELIKRLEEK